METSNNDLKNSLDIDNKTGENHSGARPNLPVRNLAASSIIGDKILNSAGENLGKIKDIMINLDNGSIEYIVVEFGGFLGMGEKYFAFPYDAMTIDTENHAFILNRSKEEFEKAPGFDKTHWPETNSHEFRGYSSGWGGFMGSNAGSEY
ncbi:MAG TPA: PRC-barrel domain-containing protein [Chryseolinea sp.]|nr:PRC-barrel domain-containing protein [Chryseolinea sp.]